MTHRIPIIALALAAAVAHGEPLTTPNADSMTPSNTTAAAPLAETDARALAVLKFWRDAGPARWFAKDPAFDARFREAFASDYRAAARGDLMHWQRSAEGAFALIVLLDQYPRNSFRDTPKMYETDFLARKVANTAVAAGYDKQLPLELRKFFALPFAHSELLADQERAVQLAASMGADDLAHAQHHRDIVKRFGRFPHRNKILGRESTKEELDYLANGGYQG